MILNSYWSYAGPPGINPVFRTQSTVEPGKCTQPQKSVSKSQLKSALNIQNTYFPKKRKVSLFDRFILPFND